LPGVLVTQLYDQIDAIFHPKSIAFVGLKIGDNTHWTRTFWDAQLAFKFKGGLYPVNPRGGELDGFKVYTSLAEIPGEVDYAIGTVAARIAPEIVSQCAAKGIKAIQFCTSGFAETGEKVVAGLQEEIVEISRRTGIRVIGPNCMGLYCPESRISFDGDFSKEPGYIGFISQSGGNTDFLIHEAGWRGVRFSKAVSFGNACDLNESDFLEYMMDDPQTKIIALYLEGVKDGKRFFRLMEKASKKKTIILLKGGYGTAGARATATHTASLAGNDATWDALCRQMNIIRPHNVEQLVDLLVTLTFIPDPGGRNMVLIGPGGGASVLLTDEFERRGFHLPAMPDHMKEELLSFSQAEGNMLNNPVDFSQSMSSPGSLVRAIKLLTDWKAIDFCVSFFRPSQCPQGALDDMLKGGLTINKALDVASKPVCFICEDGVLPERSKIMYQLRQNIVKSGKALYYRFTDAADALKTIVDYNERRKAAGSK
jgi:acyl-CoA synthetase (NDP forming)